LLSLEPKPLHLCRHLSAIVLDTGYRDLIDRRKFAFKQVGDGIIQ
jgi:hypothetical protein